MDRDPECNGADSMTRQLRCHAVCYAGEVREGRQLKIDGSSLITLVIGTVRDMAGIVSLCPATEDNGRKLCYIVDWLPSYSVGTNPSCAT